MFERSSEFLFILYTAGIGDNEIKVYQLSWGVDFGHVRANERAWNDRYVTIRTAENCVLPQWIPENAMPWYGSEPLKLDESLIADIHLRMAVTLEWALSSHHKLENDRIDGVVGVRRVLRFGVPCVITVIVKIDLKLGGNGALRNVRSTTSNRTLSFYCNVGVWEELIEIKPNVSEYENGRCFVPRWMWNDPSIWVDKHLCPNLDSNGFLKRFCGWQEHRSSPITVSLRF